MEIIKRSGEVELFAADKLERALKAASLDLPQVDPERLVERVLPSLTSTESTDTRSVALAVTLAAAEMGTFEPEYDKFAGRYLISIIDKDVASHGITKFSESIKKGHAVGLISDSTAEFVKNHAEELDNTINPARCDSRQISFAPPNKAHCARNASNVVTSCCVWAGKRYRGSENFLRNTFIARVFARNAYSF